MGASSKLSELFTHELYGIDIVEFLRRPLYRDRGFLHACFVEKSESPRYIAKKIGCSISTINNTLNSMDLLRYEITESNHTLLSRGNPPYGKKKIKGVLVDHLGERKVLKRILELRNDGVSYNNIAKYLNKLKVPTKKKQGEWCAATIQKIVKIYRKNVV